MYFIKSDIYHRYAILGIDPGLASCGTCVFIFENNILVSITPETILNHRIKLKGDLQTETHGERQVKLEMLHEAIVAKVSAHPIIAVACESPFYNPRMPGAFGSLVETVTNIRSAVARVNPDIPFHLFSPQEVKKAMGKGGTKGKMIMLEALNDNQYLTSKLTLPTSSLDEHSIDATAVGYTWLQSYKDYLQWT